MSTGKMIAIGLLLAGASACTAETVPPATASQGTPASLDVRATPAPADGAASAWWVSRSFAAGGTAVRGIPVATIDPAWRGVTELNDAHLRSTLSFAEYAEIATNGFAQSLTDGPNTLVVGTYRTDAGGGRFLLALAGGKVVAKLTQSGPQAFSTLKRVGNSIQWYKCMECGDYDTVVRAGTGYAIE